MSVGHQLNLINNRINALQTQVDNLERQVHQINRTAINNANRISKIEKRFARAAEMVKRIEAKRGTP